MGGAFYAFFQTKGTIAPVFLRLALFLIFGHHGAQKAFGWFGGNGFAETVAAMSSPESLGIPIPLAVIAIVSEVVASILLLLGLATRLAAVLTVAVMAGALTLVHIGSSFLTMEFPILVLACGFSLAISGAGAFSLDRRIAEGLMPPYSAGLRGLRLT